MVWWDGGECGPSYEGGGRKFLVIYWEGVRTFPSVIIKMYQRLWKGVPPNLPLLLKFQIFFFTSRRHSQK